MDRFTPAAEASLRTLTPFNPCRANSGVAAARILERESGEPNRASSYKRSFNILTSTVRRAQDKFGKEVSGRHNHFRDVPALPETICRPTVGRITTVLENAQNARP